jgi:type I restriction enzyme M protein
MVDRTHRELTDEDIARIANTYYTRRGQPLETPPLGTPGSSPAPSATLERGGPRYCDIPGFCKSAMLEEIRKHGHVLTPGRYVGAEAQEDGGEPFGEKMQRLTATLREQQAEAAKLDAAIATNLHELGFWRDAP